MGRTEALATPLKWWWWWWADGDSCLMIDIHAVISLMFWEKREDEESWGRRERIEGALGNVGCACASPPQRHLEY